MRRKSLPNNVLGFYFDETPSSHGDRLFIVTLIILCTLGILMVYSSSFYKAFDSYRDPYFYLKEHLVRLGIGFCLFLIAYRFDYHWLRRWSILPLIVCLMALVWVLFSGDGVNRWLTVLGIRLQPSEFARLALVIYMADWCSRNSKKLQDSFSGFIFMILLILLTTGLVIMEPSYSAGVMIFLSGAMLLVLSGARWRYLFSVMLPALPAVAYLAIAQPYRFVRLLTYLNPMADPLGAGYQVTQSKIAVGSGQVWGLGFGMSGQKFHFLPEAHCDFIFSIFCEERGFIGGAIVVLLFIILVWRGLRIARRAPDQFGFLLAGGLTASIALFALVNIGVTLGVLPVTGLPLPFISYGGSALIANLIACGIMLNVSRHTDSPEAI